LTSKPGNGNGASERVAVKQACTVLYDALPDLDPARLQSQLEPLVGPCSIDWDQKAARDGMPLVGGMAQFGSHQVAMLALNAPVMKEVLDRTVGVSPMPEDKRAQLLGHKAAIRLLYLGNAPEPLEQLTALYHVAGALLSEGGLGVLDERAALAQPAELVESYLPQLGGDPPLVPLWVGVVTFDGGDEAVRRYLIRTYGMEQFGLTDLGLYLAGRSGADDAYHLLMNVCLYLVEGQPSLHIEAGHTAEFNGRTYLFTTPEEHGAQPADDGGLMLLVEV
jgi:hypothetical protein